jgi:hypothetical protein
VVDGGVSERSGMRDPGVGEERRQLRPVLLRRLGVRVPGGKPLYEF